MGFNTFPCNPYPISTEELNSNKANQITIAPFFNAETAYTAGDLVYYNGLIYRCTNDHEGEWDADDFAATTIAGELDSLKNGLTGYYAAHVKSVTKELTVSNDVNHVISFGITLPNIVIAAYTSGQIICPDNTYNNEWIGIILDFDGTKVTSGSFEVTIFYLEP